MTITQFEHGYWYAVDLKHFATELGIRGASGLRKDELEQAIKVFLRTGAIVQPARRTPSASTAKDVERGLHLDRRVVRYTNDRETKQFLEQEARKLVPGLRRRSGNHPFGALLVLDGKVVLTAGNTVGTDRDPTAHAETNLVAAAIRHLAPDQIRRSVLYTSCEPCAMCVGKMYWAGIRSVVYALPAEELALLAGRDFLIPCRELFDRATESVHIGGPLLLNEAREVHRGFWPPPAAEAQDIRQ